MKALIIDDETYILRSLSGILQDEGWEADTAENGEEGLQKALKEKYTLIFCDIKMPGLDGHELLRKLMEEGTESPVVMMSGHADINEAVSCIKDGAYDFLVKPVELSRLLVLMRNAGEKVSLVRETKRLKKKVFKSDMVGESPAMAALREMVAKVAPTDARVLITGPNGSGKELVARSLHQQSRRADKPYVEVNCAAIPSELIESELFGHEKGSFTSAVRQHKGKFEQADGGTLFLDEIGDMSLPAQAKMLRVLQEKKLSRVGSDQDIPVDVRVIAATNKDLHAEIAAGRFREDLYHRLSVIVVAVPPLAERRGDIPLLCDFFIGQICEEYAMPARRIAPEAMALLQSREWSGNIRELRNVVERLLILCGGSEITPDDVRQYAL